MYITIFYEGFLTTTAHLSVTLEYIYLFHDFLGTKGEISLSRYSHLGVAARPRRQAVSAEHRPQNPRKFFFLPRNFCGRVL